jgi:hypothetical protein
MALDLKSELTVQALSIMLSMSVIAILLQLCELRYSGIGLLVSSRRAGSATYVLLRCSGDCVPILLHGFAHNSQFFFFAFGGQDVGTVFSTRKRIASPISIVFFPPHSLGA